MDINNQLELLEMKSTKVEIKKKCDELVDSIQSERISELEDSAENCTYNVAQKSIV